MNNVNDKNHHIAFVEDDPGLADWMESYYSARKFMIHRFEKAEALLEELKSAESGRPPYDLVLTDLMMPAMDGIELTRNIKALFPELPVVVLTGSSSVDSSIEAIGVGASDYIVKPPNFPHLTVVLQRALYFAELRREDALALKHDVLSQNGTPGLGGLGVVAKSASVRSAIELAKRVAPSDATMLITGESGTGKEVFANLIHRLSKRADKPFVAINCAAIPENLLESELFGHAKGSFTGAESARAGIFEDANGGTLFLDEISDMPMHLQAKLLRVLQERKIRRVGENVFRDVDVRIIAATLRNLGEEVAAQRFREDLFYRLNVVPLRLPSLRQRRDDILPLAKHFLAKFALHYGKELRGFSREAAEWILTRDWKGNIRELENSVERAAVMARGSWIDVGDIQLESQAESATALQPDNETLLSELEPMETLAPDLPASPEAVSAAVDPRIRLSGEPMTLEELELLYIQNVLEKCDGVKERAAKVLGIDRKTLYRKIQARRQEGHPEQQAMGVL